MEETLVENVKSFHPPPAKNSVAIVFFSAIFFPAP